jgi:hypothetical protein
MATLEEGSYKSTMSDLGQYQGFSVPERWRCGTEETAGNKR